MQKIRKYYSYNAFLNLYTRYKTFIRFLIVGCINTGVDFATFSILYSLLGIDKLICQVLGYSTGIVNSFIMNKLWTFKDRNTGGGIVNQSIRFILVNSISLGISLVALRILNDIYHINVYISKIIVTGIAQCMNYFCYKLVVFEDKKL